MNRSVRLLQRMLAVKVQREAREASPARGAVQATGGVLPAVRWVAAPAILIAFAYLTPACTTFHPLGVDPEVGTQVRARLTPVGQVRQASATGVARDALDGSVLAVNDEEFVLVVPIPGLVPAYQRSPKVADTLHVARVDVTAIEAQRFSAARSALLAGGVLATGVLGVALAGAAGSPDGTDDPGDRTALRPWRPILTITIGR